VWDGLGGHKSRVMLDYLARARTWLTVERLPDYASELNPVEQIWGNIKGRELANLCPADILAPPPATARGLRPHPSTIVAGLRLLAARGTGILT
jgi:transposase